MQLVADIIAEAKASRMTVIAEGIETEEQMWALRRMGCDLLQGNYIAHPLDAIAAGAVLAKRFTTPTSNRY